MLKSIERKNASRMDPRHVHGIVTDSSEKGGDDWVDLGREEETHAAHSSHVSSHDTNSNGPSGAHPHEHDETFDIRDGVHAVHAAEQTAVRSGKINNSLQHTG